MCNLLFIAPAAVVLAGAVAATLPAQSCPSFNDIRPLPNTDIRRGTVLFVRSGYEYAYEVTTSSAIDVTGFSMPTGYQSACSGPVTMQTFLFEASPSGGPMPAPSRTSTMSLPRDTAAWTDTTFSPPLTVPAGGRFYIGYRHPGTACIFKNVSFDPTAPVALGEFDRVAGTQTWIGPCESLPGYLCRPLMWRVSCSPAGSAAGYLWDGDFSGWSSQLLGNGRSSGWMRRDATGGNPGACARVMTYPEGGSNPGNALVACWKPSNVWNPRTQGAIRSVSMTLDCKTVSSAVPDGQGLALLAVQGGRYYVSYTYPGDVTGRSTSWRTLSRAGRAAASFFEVWPSVPASQPDFSARGAPIAFGFLAWNSSGSSRYSVTNLYDNLRVTVATVGGTVSYSGSGCPVGVFESVIGVGGTPRIGQPLTFTLGNHAPTGTVYYQNCHLLAGFTTVSYPIPTSSSCTLLVAPDAVVWVGSGLGGIVAPPLTIPNDPHLIGLEVHFQWVSLVPAVLASNRATVVVGG